MNSRQIWRKNIMEFIISVYIAILLYAQPMCRAQYFFFLKRIMLWIHIRRIYIYIVNRCVFVLVGKISYRFRMQRRNVSAEKVLFWYSHVDNILKWKWIMTFNTHTVWLMLPLILLYFSIITVIRPMYVLKLLFWQYRHVRFIQFIRDAVENKNKKVPKRICS